MGLHKARGAHLKGIEGSILGYIYIYIYIYVDQGFQKLGMPLKASEGCI